MSKDVYAGIHASRQRMRTYGDYSLSNSRPGAGRLPSAVSPRPPGSGLAPGLISPRYGLDRRAPVYGAHSLGALRPPRTAGGVASERSLSYRHLPRTPDAVSERVSAPPDTHCTADEVS